MQPRAPLSRSGDSMTQNRNECPECGSYDTKQVHTQGEMDMIEVTRICNDCPMQFTNQYSLFNKKRSIEMYQCEQCGTLVNEYDATLQTEEGHDETITLAFCKECSQ